MVRREAIILALCFAVFPVAAWAQGNGNGNSSGNANGNGNDNGNDPGNRPVPGHNNGGGASGGNHHSRGNGNANAGNGNPANRPQANEAQSGKTPLSQDDVLAAVESGRAVPLEVILPDVRSRTGGEIVDAQLQRVQGFLIYEVTVLTPDGKLITEFYYARSGNHVESR